MLVGSFLCFALARDGGEGFSRVQVSDVNHNIPHPHCALWAASLRPVIWKVRFLLLMKA